MVQLAFGQSKTSLADVKMLSSYGTKNFELLTVLEFQKIEYYNVKFVGQNLKGKYFSVYCKEMWNGKLRKKTILWLAIPNFNQLDKKATQFR